MSIMWPVIINGFGACYMLNVCVCVVPLSQPSSRYPGPGVFSQMVKMFKGKKHNNCADLC